LFRQALVEPCERGRKLRILLAEPMHELDRESIGQTPRGTVSEYDRRRLRGASAYAQKPIGEPVGLSPHSSAERYLLREAPEILYEYDLQRDRDRPKLADRERLNFLIGFDVCDQSIRIETTVSVGDERPGQAKHTGIPDERAGDELRELAIVTGGQIRADLTDLLLHQMIVVDQPLRGRRDRAALVDGRHDRAIRRKKHRAIVGESGGQRHSTSRLCGHDLSDRQAARVGLQPFEAEQFFTDGRFIVPG
jgi:hypothetical protein